jgi:D-amino-acid dehydrogenase
LNAALRESLDAPKGGIIDQRYRVSISRLGQRVRLSGGNELGNQTTHLATSLKTLYQILEDWFPGAARTQDNVQVWKGTYPTLPDGLPLIGPSGTPGVWLNIGHANHGWTLASGSARLLADTLSGRKPEIDSQGLGLERLQTGR